MKIGKIPTGFRPNQVVKYAYKVNGNRHEAWGKVVGGGTHPHLGRILVVRPYGEKDYPSIPVAIGEAKKLPYTPRIPGRNEIWDWSPFDKDVIQRRKHGLRS